MIATDPLSLVFLTCVVFSGSFLVLSTLLGAGHGHGLHLGGHTGGHLGGRIGHIGHDLGSHVASHAPGGQAPAGHAAANGHTVPSGHTIDGQTNGGAAVPAATSPWMVLSNAFYASLNLYGLLIFLLVFGLLGYLLLNMANVGVVLSLLIALAIAVGTAMGVSVLLARLFLMGEHTELTPESSQLEGRLGKVSIAIRAGGIGEVIYTGTTGARKSVGARSYDGAAIPVNTEIVVIDYRDGIASVQPWDRFMAGVRSGLAPELQPIEH
ncbi:MAG: NfeD family protein [Ktedonobacterales bacterium]